MTRRTDRLNSLLREVISEVIRKQVKNPYVGELSTVTRVDITRDLRYAKVYISVMGNEITRRDTLAALNQSAGFIAVAASKKVVLRHFPELKFCLDDTADKQLRIEELLKEINEERETREGEHEPGDS